MNRDLIPPIGSHREKQGKMHGISKGVSDSVHVSGKKRVRGSRTKGNVHLLSANPIRQSACPPVPLSMSKQLKSDVSIGIKHDAGYLNSK